MKTVWWWCLPPLSRVSVKHADIKNNGSGIRILVEFWRWVSSLKEKKKCGVADLRLLVKVPSSFVVKTPLTVSSACVEGAQLMWLLQPLLRCLVETRACWWMGNLLTLFLGSYFLSLTSCVGPVQQERNLAHFPGSRTLPAEHSVIICQVLCYLCCACCVIAGSTAYFSR